MYLKIGNVMPSVSINKDVLFSIRPYLPNKDFYNLARVCKESVETSQLSKLNQLFKDLNTNNGISFFSDITLLLKRRVPGLSEEKIILLTKKLFDLEKAYKNFEIHISLADMLYKQSPCSIDAPLIERTSLEKHKKNIDSIIENYDKSRNKENDIKNLNKSLHTIFSSIKLFNDSDYENPNCNKLFTYRLKQFLDTLKQNDIKEFDAIKRVRDYFDAIKRVRGYPLLYADDSLKKDKEVVLAAVRQKGR